MPVKLSTDEETASFLQPDIHLIPTLSPGSGSFSPNKERGIVTSIIQVSALFSLKPPEKLYL